MALIMEGKPAAAAIRARLTEKAGKLRDQGVVCGLAVVLVGDDHASIIYADWLSKLCSSLGIRYHLAALPADTTQEELLAQIAQLNASPEVSGILPMMPLPAQINPDIIARSLDPEKDVDAMHPLNVGLVAAGKSPWAPCTPRAVMTASGSGGPAAGAGQGAACRHGARVDRGWKAGRRERPPVIHAALGRSVRRGWRWDEPGRRSGRARWRPRVSAGPGPARRSR